VEKKFGDSRHRPMAAIREGLRTRYLWTKIKATANRAHQVELVLMELFPDASECDAVFQRAATGESTRATIEHWKRQIMEAK
jgi:hypothetical protein